MTSSILPLLEKATEHRNHLFDSKHESAFRLFNGFYEGYPDIILDIYGRTLVIHNYADNPTQSENIVQEVSFHLQNALSWLHAGFLKLRNGLTQEQKRGTLLFGDQPDRKIKEHNKNAEHFSLETSLTARSKNMKSGTPRT